MRTSTRKRWIDPFEISKTPTKHCRICFKIIKSDSFYETINNDSCLCEECQQKLEPQFINFTIGKTKGLAIYKYDDNIKSLLYQLKGCFDIELASIFFNRFKKELKTRYKGYVLVPAPSSKDEDTDREFNHVVEIFRFLNLPYYHLVNKNSKFKQAENTAKNRKTIIDHFTVESLEQIRDKKVLIIDDVMTTGSTLKAMVGLLSKGNPRLIRILVMAKRELK